MPKPKALVVCVYCRQGFNNKHLIMDHLKQCENQYLEHIQHSQKSTHQSTNPNKSPKTSKPEEKQSIKQI